MRRLLQILFVAFTVFIYSCKKDKRIIPVQASYHYFPTEYGKYVVYNVDSTVHRTDDQDNDDSISYFHFQLKYVIDSSFADLEGRTRQVVVCYYKDSTMDWTLRNVFSQLLTSSGAYTYEDNITYHKLAFPISSSIKWDGNDQNTNDEELYQYEDIHTSSELSSMSYDSVVTNIQFDSTIIVLQRDDVYVIGSVYGKEIYAENVGMVYHERDELEFNTSLNVTSSGTEYKMTAIDYGPR
jgi:hypothetical protein